MLLSRARISLQRRRTFVSPNHPTTSNSNDITPKSRSIKTNNTTIKQTKKKVKTSTYRYRHWRRKTTVGSTSRQEPTRDTYPPFLFVHTWGLLLLLLLVYPLEVHKKPPTDITYVPQAKASTALTPVTPFFDKSPMPSPPKRNAGRAEHLQQQYFILSYRRCHVSLFYTKDYAVCTGSTHKHTPSPAKLAGRRAQPPAQQKI